MDEHWDIENPLLWSEEEKNSPAYFVELVRLEYVYMPHEMQLADLNFRREAIYAIYQAYYLHSGDRTIIYLAMNYVDRCLDQPRTLREMKYWTAKSVAITCLSIASKVRYNTCKLRNVLVIIDQTEVLGCGAFQFELEEVRGILAVLDWKTRSITPFAFLPHLLALLHLAPDADISCDFKDRATEIFFNAHKDVYIEMASVEGTRLVDFRRPSEVASAALLFAASELVPSYEYPAFHSAILKCPILSPRKDKIEECLRILKLNDLMAKDWAVPTFMLPVTTSSSHSTRSSSVADDYDTA